MLILLLQVQLNRAKNSHQNNYLLSPQSNDWGVFSINTSGTYVILKSTRINTNVFSEVPSDKESSYVNALLSDIFEYWTQFESKNDRQLSTCSPQFEEVMQLPKVVPKADERKIAYLYL